MAGEAHHIPVEDITPQRQNIVVRVGSKVLGAFGAKPVDAAEGPAVLRPFDAQQAQEAARDPHDTGEHLLPAGKARMQALIANTGGDIKRPDRLH